jgi:integrase
MSRPRKPYLQKELTRHGKVVWYFRRGKEKRIRLSGTYGSREFNAAYDAALAGVAIQKKATPSQSSLRWLVDRYYASGRFEKMQPNTQRNHRLMLESVCKTGGALSFRLLTAAEVRAGMVRREGTPRMAATYVSVMRALFDFAKDNAWIDHNPVVEDIKARGAKTDGYHSWTDEQVEQYQRCHPVGTLARLALDIMLYTGLRRSDAIAFGRQHISNGTITIRAGKNRADIIIPLLPPLAASIEASKDKCGDMVFLINARHQPWKNIAFGYWFAARCDEANLPTECRAHGLRKAGATMAANNGATPHELSAMYGWASTKMAEIYTKKADRIRLAERAANKLYPHPEKGAGKNRPTD